MQKHLFFTFALCYSIITTARTHTLWQIGTKDDSYSEFALSEKNYRDFVPQGLFQ